MTQYSAQVAFRIVFVTCLGSALHSIAIGAATDTPSTSRSGGCTHDIECDDGMPCTSDFCDFPPVGPVGGGICEHEPVPDGQPGGVGGPACAQEFGLLCGGCDDGLFCNGAETCQSGACVAGTPPCPGVCSETFDMCQDLACTTGADCSDAGIVGAELAAVAALHCNGTETCVSGVCVAGSNPCGSGAVCSEKRCSFAGSPNLSLVNNAFCITDEDCAEFTGSTCTVVGPACKEGRCCTGSTEPTCARRAKFAGRCALGANNAAPCINNSQCASNNCNTTSGVGQSCDNAGGLFYGHDAGTIPSGGGSVCPPDVGGVAVKCPKYSSGIAPSGPIAGHVGLASGSGIPNVAAGVAIKKLGDDYKFTNSGVCVGGVRDGLGCADDASCSTGGICNLSVTSVMSVYYIRMIGGFFPYTRVVVEFRDMAGRFVAESYVERQTAAEIERLFMDPPLIVPSEGFVIIRVASEYTPNGGFIWSSTDAVDIGSNDPDVLWVNDGPVANFLAPNPGILAFEIEGEKVAAPLGACCDSDGIACTDGVLPWVCEGDGNVFQGADTTCPVPACDTGACCDAATGACTVGTESDCTTTGGDFQGYGTDCDVDNGYDSAAQHCCPQTFTAGDRCEDAIVHAIAVPPPGGDPVVVTITGDNSPAIFQPADYCCSDDCYIDFGWWEAFEIDAYAYVRIDFCCSEPMHRQFYRALFDCPCGQSIMSSANPFRFPESDFGRGEPYCDDGNPWVNFGPLPPGRYYYPMYSVREGIHGPYQLHITVEALPTAACCVADQCSDGLNAVECEALGGNFLGPPQRVPLVPNCSTSPCATGSCCSGPGQCFDSILGQPATPTDCANNQATFSGGVRCFGGSCDGSPQTSCRFNSDCSGNANCLGSAQQLSQPSPCPICSVESTQSCQAFQNNLEFTPSDRSMGFDGMLSADDFRPEGTVLDRVCVWGFFVDLDVEATDPDCGTSSSDDRFRVRVFATNPATGRSPGDLVGESLATSTRGEIPGTLITQRLQVPVFGFELALNDPIEGLVPGELYWIEVSNDVSETHPNCGWFWFQRSATSLGLSFHGGQSGYAVHQGVPYDNVFCLNMRFSPMSPDLLSAACCTCDGNCTASTLYDCVNNNGVWDITHPTCDGVVCPAGPPPNDNCVDGPQPIAEGTYTVSNQCATTDGYGPLTWEGALQIDFDLWYHYIAPGTCDLVISECQTGLLFDSALAVYYNPDNLTQCPPCPLNAVTSAQHLAGIPQDESCLGVAMGGAGYWRASEQIGRPAYPGECFLLRIGSFPGSRGTAILDVSCEPIGPIPLPDPSGLTKTRFISFQVPPEASGEWALMVKLASLHHVVPPYTGGASTPFSSFEGHVRWAGPPVQFIESTASGTPFLVSQLQCTPHYQDWSALGVLHVTGSAIVPSSNYEVTLIPESCMGNEHNCAAAAGPLSISTSRRGDVTAPYNPPDASAQPDLGDIAALVSKFRDAPGAPIKARALLAGVDPFGNVNLGVDFDFSHIAACVDAFRGQPYPYSISICP